MVNPLKEYLGDGVYVFRHQFGVTLTTENGIEVTNKIVMEPEVIEAFQTWLDRTFGERL